MKYKGLDFCKEHSENINSDKINEKIDVSYFEKPYKQAFMEDTLKVFVERLRMNQDGT